MTFLPVRPVIIETEISAAAHQWKSFGVGMKPSPSATAVATLTKGVTTWVHTLREMCPLVARDGRLVSAAPPAIIEAAGKDEFALATRLAGPCGSIMRFL